MTRISLVALLVWAWPATAAAPPAPPSPPRSPAEELASFTVAPGFRVELVASEPLVEAPVALSFDADGRLWVVEMVGFMPGVEGEGESEPNGRVAVLEDSDGDGRMDRRTVFADGLVLPRAVGLVAGGALIGAPPELIYCRDRDGDLRCDERTVVATDYGTPSNPEHTANGLVTALDNWVYSANLAVRFRRDGDGWRRERTLSRGQWGIAQDDAGRLFYNTNSDYLRGDFLPAFSPDAHARGAGLNASIDKDQSVWPGRPNLGVNRGYKDGTLRADGTLARFTAACGPTIYRGDQFGPEFSGNAFVAEPAANLIRRAVLSDDGASVSAHNPYAKGEFLTSTDERFRPVNLTTGPDGALYVVDLYRGLIQHRIYLTPYLKEQIKQRGLEGPLDRGRIWRVVRTGKPLGPRPALGGAKSAALVAALGHPNGWWRDTAQRLLVERRERAAVAPLRRLARGSADGRARLHALFALEGMHALDGGTLAAAGKDRDRFVRLAAASLVEAGAREKLGAVARATARKPALAGATALVAGREAELLERMLAEPEWAVRRPGRAELLTSLARRVAEAGRPAKITRVLELAAAAEPAEATWRPSALLDGLSGLAREKPLPAVPEGWSKLVRAPAPEVRERAVALALFVTGRPATVAPRARALTAEEEARFTRGKAQYGGICGACHQPSGLGEDGKGPPLVDSDWVLGAPERLVRIALHGLRGPVTVDGKTFEMEMPALGALPDPLLADLLTYVRRESAWGHQASPVDPETIARIRQATAGREESWTVEELLKVRPARTRNATANN